MYRQGVGDFKYYVGISSLAQVATRDDRVCVLNILGGESSDVTPVGHAYSGGNVVFGTSPGRRGQVLETPLGNIPVYNNVLEGLRGGPSLQLRRDLSAAVGRTRRRRRTDPRQSRSARRSSSSPKSCRCTTRARFARWGSRTASTSSAATASASPTPGTACASAARSAATVPPRHCKGSIAIFSNSGNFTTTIAHLPAHGRLGHDDASSRAARTSTSISPRRSSRSRSPTTRAARRRCCTVEPGGYYELDADFTQAGGRLRGGTLEEQADARGRPCRRDGRRHRRRASQGTLVHGEVRRRPPVHARRSGAARAKGALVTNIAHIPAALTAVMRENATRPDFEPEGSLALKPWFGSTQGLELPAELRLARRDALAPYDAQIAQLEPAGRQRAAASDA